MARNTSKSSNGSRALDERVAATGECPNCHGDGDMLTWNTDALYYEITPCAACQGKGQRILTDTEQRAMLLYISTRGDN